MDYEVESFDLKTIVTAASNVAFIMEDIRRFGVCLPFGDRLLGIINYQIERKFALHCRQRGGEALMLFRKSA
jgi:hypothetical protein